MTPLLSRTLRLAVLIDALAGVRSAPEGQLPDITDRAFIDACVLAHNGHRSNVTPTASDMRYMTWDGALAKSARAWARSCRFSHNPLLTTPRKLHPQFHPVGENLWVGESVSGFQAEKAIQKWHEEVTDFTYSTLACRPNKMCGHYKQVVWAQSYKVGCAVQFCPNGVEEYSKKKSTIFVCNYGEAGNFRGFPPYSEGASCSACDGGTCERHLCRDSKRDEEKSYSSWSPDWDPGAASSASCSAACLAGLVPRPLSLLLMCAGVYGLQVLRQILFAHE
ncbi:GLIPR1-like protein 1 [Anguilla rostrata]|uniref:GLIPR1-like protein 1 n=1 Tax=Anguilla rostrata TaxID=7938 RepID=UPI0030D1D4E9